MASDIELEFDLVTGKNEVSKSIDGIKNSAKASQSTIDIMLGKFTSVSQEVKKAEKTQQGFFSSIKSGASEAYSSFASISLGITAVTGVIAASVYSVKEFVGAAVESEDSVSRLNVALKQTGIYTESSSKEFQKLAASIQETTVYSDDQAMSLISTLQNLGQFTNEGLKQATKASIELASAFKLDLNTAATLVGKAANGNTTALGRMGIEIKKGKTDAETFANTLQALERLQGSSAAEVNTLGGSFKYLSNQIGEAAETFGTIIAETLNLKSSSIELAKSLKKVNEEIKTNAVAKAAENIKSARSEYNGLTEDIDETIDAYQRLRDERSKLSNEKLFATEENIAKQSDAIKSILSLSQNNIAPNPFTPMLSDIAKAREESNNLLQDTANRREEAAKKEQEARTAARKDYEAMIVQIKNAGKTQLEIIESERLSRIKIISDLFKNGYASAIELADAQFKIDQEYIQKKKEITDKANEESFKKAQELAEQEAKWTLEQIKMQQEERAKGINAVLGGASSVLNGKEGARQLLSSGVGSAADMFAPGTGQAASMLFNQLSQGPEATRAMVKEFAASVPIIIDAVIQSIPVLIDELSKQFPNVIQAMSDRLNDPSFWESFIKNMTKAAVASATAVPKAFIAQIPTFFQSFGRELINAIVNGIGSALSGLIDAINPFSGSDNGLLGLGILGLARGGQVSSVPNGFPNDTFPAMLTSNELVVDRSTAQRLNDFLDADQGNESSITDSLLVKIYEKLSEPINVSTSANLNGRAFADIILELNRSNARLTA